MLWPISTTTRPESGWGEDIDSPAETRKARDYSAVMPSGAKQSRAGCEPPYPPSFRDRPRGGPPKPGTRTCERSAQQPGLSCEDAVSWFRVRGVAPARNDLRFGVVNFSRGSSKVRAEITFRARRGI